MARSDMTACDRTAASPAIGAVRGRARRPCGPRTLCGSRGVCARSVRGPRRRGDSTLVLGAGIAISHDMLLLLILLLCLAVVGGGFGYSRYGYAGWSPAAIVVVILVLLALTGRL